MIVYDNLFLSSITATICLKILILQVALSKELHATQESVCLEMAPYCTCTYIYDELNQIQLSLNCDKFDYFADLNFTSLNRFDLRFLEVKLFPRQTNMLIKQSLNLQSIIIDNNAAVYLSNISAFDLEFNPFKDSDPNFGFITDLYIENSNITFVNNDGRCDRNAKYESTVFSTFRNIHIFTGTYEKVNICPFLFHNSFLTGPYLLSLHIDRPNTNIEFAQLSPDDGIFLSSNIRAFEIHSDTDRMLTLDSKLFEPFTFKQIQSFKLFNSRLETIDDVIFANFKQINFLFLGITNMNSFFGKPNNTKWLSSLNGPIGDYGSELLVTLEDQSVIGTTYKYPDSDFCKFLNFPSDKKVFMQISAAVTISNKPNYQYECTCTLFWLLKNRYGDPSLISNTSCVSKCFSSPFINQTIEKCQLEQKVCACDASCVLPTNTTSSSATMKFIIEIVLVTTIPSVVLIILTVGFIVYFYRRKQKLLG